jgi:hypothetical protein
MTLSLFNDAPIIIPVPKLDLPIAAIKRRLGYPSAESNMEDNIGRLFKHALETAKEIMSPSAILQYRSILSINEDMIHFRNDNFTIMSKQVSKLLCRAKQAVFFFCTIGSALESEVENLHKQNRITESVLLDAVGSEAADAVADYIHHQVIQTGAREKGLAITPRFSPGFGDWPVTVQGRFLEQCQAHRIGISVNESFLMHPRKSVSAVLGLVSETG